MSSNQRFHLPEERLIPTEVYDPAYVVPILRVSEKVFPPIFGCSVVINRLNRAVGIKLSNNAQVFVRDKLPLKDGTFILPKTDYLLREKNLLQPLLQLGMRLVFTSELPGDLDCLIKWTAPLTGIFYFMEANSYREGYAGNHLRTWLFRDTLLSYIPCQCGYASSHATDQGKRGSLEDLRPLYESLTGGTMKKVLSAEAVESYVRKLEREVTLLVGTAPRHFSFPGELINRMAVSFSSEVIQDYTKELPDWYSELCSWGKHFEKTATIEAHVLGSLEHGFYSDRQSALLAELAKVPDLAPNSIVIKKTDETTPMTKTTMYEWLADCVEVFVLRGYYEPLYGQPILRREEGTLKSYTGAQFVSFAKASWLYELQKGNKSIVPITAYWIFRKEKTPERTPYKRLIEALLRNYSHPFIKLAAKTLNGKLASVLTKSANYNLGSQLQEIPAGKSSHPASGGERLGVEQVLNPLANILARMSMLDSYNTSMRQRIDIEGNAHLKSSADASLASKFIVNAKNGTGTGLFRVPIEGPLIIPNDNHSDYPGSKHRINLQELVENSPDKAQVLYGEYSERRVTFKEAFLTESILYGLDHKQLLMAFEDVGNILQRRVAVPLGSSKTIGTDITARDLKEGHLSSRRLPATIPELNSLVKRSKEEEEDENN